MEIDIQLTGMKRIRGWSEYNNSDLMPSEKLDKEVAQERTHKQMEGLLTLHMSY